jgi:uncharacterized protein
MSNYFIESSALIKRYKTEAGSDVVNGLFDNGNNLFYLNLAIIEVRKVFYRQWKYPLQQDIQINEEEFSALENRFAADIQQMNRVEFTEEMIQETANVLDSVWVPSVFDLVQLTSYLISRQSYPDLIFVCSDERSRLVEAAKNVVPKTSVLVPEVSA